MTRRQLGELILTGLLTGLTLSAAFILISPGLDAEPVQSERLAAAGRLWAAIKYFHPYLAYRDIDWDAAWVQAYPAISSAKDLASYSKAIEQLVAPLHDPVTKIASEPPTLPEGGSIATKWETDSVLTITVPNSSDFPAMIEKLRQTSDDVRKASVIVFDLRAAGPDFPYALDTSGIDRLLSNTVVSAPAERRRFHSGLVSESVTSGGYYSGFQVAEGQRLEPGDMKGEKRCVFLVSERSYVAPIALALQSAGKAMIISEGAITDENLVTTARIQLADGLEAEIRLGELVYTDGTTGFVPDAVVTEQDGMKAALAAAMQGAASKGRDRIHVPAVPVARRQPNYADTGYPTSAYRTLAAIQIWAAHNYLYPYKKLMNEDWNAVLDEFVQKLDAAKDENEYHLGIAEMLTHVHDSHSGASSSVLKRYYGETQPPVTLRWIEDAPVVTAILDKDVADRSGIALGDAVVGLDGRDVSDRIRDLSTHLSASTPQALMEKVCSRLLNGPPGSTVSLQIRNPQGVLRTTILPRKPEYQEQMGNSGVGETVRWVADSIGYADLNRLTVPMVDDMFEKFRSARAVIFDMRGYPQGTAWSIAPRLSERKSPVGALFSRPVAMAPDASLTQPTETLTLSFTQPIPATDKWRYTGQTVMLIDERTISQAEHTGLFFEAANGTKFVGTPTSGANGDVTVFSVPGGIRISMTGHDVRHADGRQLQRVGLQPDVRVAPTIAGIAAGKDEVLDRAIQFINSGK
jgi:C-terminal processing protease CtpA/Prc